MQVLRPWQWWELWRILLWLSSCRSSCWDLWRMLSDWGEMGDQVQASWLCCPGCWGCSEESPRVASVESCFWNVSIIFMLLTESNLTNDHLVVCHHWKAAESPIMATLVPQARQARASDKNLNYMTLASQTILTICWVVSVISYYIIIDSDPSIQFNAHKKWMTSVVAALR